LLAISALTALPSIAPSIEGRACGRFAFELSTSAQMAPPAHHSTGNENAIQPQRLLRDAPTGEKSLILLRVAQWTRFIYISGYLECTGIDCGWRAPQPNTPRTGQAASGVSPLI
jgi:hypothetical protein